MTAQDAVPGEAGLETRPLDAPTLPATLREEPSLLHALRDQRRQHSREILTSCTAPLQERTDRIIRLAKHLFRAQAYITIMGQDQAWMKDALGGDYFRDEPCVRCAQTLDTDGIHIIEDGRDAAGGVDGFSEHVSGFYAGCAIELASRRVGVFSVVDKMPRTLGHAEKELVCDFAAMVGRELLIVKAAEAQLRLAHAYDQLWLQAHVDGLTHTWNRDVVLRLAELERRRAAPGALAAVIVVDIDNLKLINDTYGLAAGDEVLRATGVQLRAATHAMGIVGRLGNDEFAVLLHNVERPRIHDLVEHLRVDLVREPVHFNGSRMPVTYSIGYTIDSSVRPFEMLLARADLARQQATMEEPDPVQGNDSETCPEICRGDGRLVSGMLLGQADLARAQMELDGHACTKVGSDTAIMM